MLFTLRKCRAEDAPARFVYQHLRFHRVPFFLAAVPFPLFFLGRLHGVSVASTSTTSYCTLFFANAFFPGK
jgi:hypothetical protein